MKDLAKKYLGEEEANEIKENKIQSSGKQGMIAIIGGLFLFIGGMSFSSESTVYYGLVWVGTSAFLRGIWCSIAQEDLFETSWMPTYSNSI